MTPGGPPPAPPTGGGGPPHRIVVVGDVVTDVLAVLAGPVAPGSDTSAEIRVTGGGQAANTAAWLAWQGCPVTLVGAVGVDDAGSSRIAELTTLGVHCAVRRDPDAPTGTVIVLAGDGERTMVTQRGANLRLTPEQVDAALGETLDAGHLHLSAYTLLDAGSRRAGLAALAAARGRGLSTSVDAASAEPLRRVGAPAFLAWVRDADLLLANADEAVVLAGPGTPAAQARTLTRVARHVVVKDGAAGAVWAERGGPVVSVPARRVPVRDVTGAGDAFAAGLLAARIGGASPAEALDRAAELGAAAVGTLGARPPAERS
ncbi:PfkB family carbohydrate kinase [Micromonospora sp. WMMD1102]|uniref:carbohydrate kinase family protein n=1 Tax=Micromonospora sp. WMMD1102 TaxID=3016105 RepID=UPI002414D111|nr:PfkB family carbohydrate kinase [Micromonospora sp. WMMD1102]MDG4785826.1 PfkB family carbohydrate kinase [Micromonospora sp. WMMD1102]